MDKLPITEITPVIQGEGRSTGEPMVLIRMGKCELNCQFKESICDSSETSWLHNANNLKFSLNDIEEVLDKNPQIKKVMITGGHPFSSPNEYIEIAKLIRKKGLSIEVESNGLGYLPIYEGLVDLITISPKLSNSTPVPGTFIPELGRVITDKDKEKHEKARKNNKSMSSWMKNFDYQFKFVISSESDITEAISLMISLDIDLSKVFFMPEAGNRKQLEQNSPWLYQRCLELGVKFSTRLHIQLFDNKKYV